MQDMRSEISFLRRKLDESDEANKENRRLIAALTQRIPAIEAPAADSSEPRESVVRDSEDTVKGDIPQDSVDGQNRQSWWQRWFGG